MEAHMTNHVRLIGTAIFGIGLAMSAGFSAASAQNATYLSRDATYCEIFRSLSTVVPRECTKEGDFIAATGLREGMLTRGIVRRVAKQATQEPVAIQKDPPKALSVALNVQFEFDSAELTPEAVEVLDRVSAVFNNGLMTDTYIQIEGHADASGSAEYNQSLSTQRALTVRDFLVERHGIDPNRLLARGKGEIEPYDRSDPYAKINRRVEFLNISG
jgi:outer membrane protein OmpA-like peptidoglycan-associated protein